MNTINLSWDYQSHISNYIAITPDGSQYKVYENPQDPLSRTGFTWHWVLSVPNLAPYPAPIIFNDEAFATEKDAMNSAQRHHDADPVYKARRSQAQSVTQTENTN